MMDRSTFLYLNAADVAKIDLDPAASRRALIAAFRAHHEQRIVAKPKLSLEIGPGHFFQSLCSAWGDVGFASTKWLGVAPVTPGSGETSIHATIMLNDFASGRLVALLDGNVITGIRTAAMSAAAAHYLASPESRRLGLIGCGVQARSHMAAMKSVLPNLSEIRAHSRSRTSAERLVADAREGGWEATVSDDAETVVRNSDVIVTTIPMSPGFAPFLDPDWIAPGAFVSAVDVGRSWLPEKLRRLDRVVTDDHIQQAQSPPLSGDFGRLGSFDADLAELAGGEKPGRQSPGERAMFVFRGLGLADLAIAACCYEAAKEKGLGQELRR